MLFFFNLGNELEVLSPGNALLLRCPIESRDTIGTMAYALVLTLIPAAFLLSRWIGGRIALPLLTGISIYFPFLLEVQKSVWNAMLLLLFWVVLQSLLLLRIAWKAPEMARSLIWRSDEYTQSMFRWIETGNLPEGDAFSVIRFHLKQTILYCILAAITANFGALILGSALLNYMNYYVARLGIQSGTVRAIVLGWNPWSVIRVLSFLYLGTVLSLPALALALNVDIPSSFWILVPGITGLLLDVGLKLLISSGWRRKLQKL